MAMIIGTWTGSAIRTRELPEKLAIHSNGSRYAGDKDRITPLAKRSLHSRVPSSAGVRQHTYRRPKALTF